MSTQWPESIPYDEFPWRLFLDSSTLQYLQEYGEYIYNGGSIRPSNRLYSVPFGEENVEALRLIMAVGARAPLQLVLSGNSIEEVAARGRHVYLQWAFEIVDYWESILQTYEADGVEAFSGKGSFLARDIASGCFGYLSNKDARLLKDAVLLECDAFITMDLKLTKNAKHIQSKLGILIVEPRRYWSLLRPWAALFH